MFAADLNTASSVFEARAFPDAFTRPRAILVGAPVTTHSCFLERRVTSTKGPK